MLYIFLTISQNKAKSWNWNNWRICLKFQRPQVLCGITLAPLFSSKIKFNFREWLLKLRDFFGNICKKIFWNFSLLIKSFSWISKCDTKFILYVRIKPMWFTPVYTLITCNSAWMNLPPVCWWFWDRDNAVVYPEVMQRTGYSSSKGRYSLLI